MFKSRTLNLFTVLILLATPVVLASVLPSILARPDWNTVIDWRWWTFKQTVLPAVLAVIFAVIALVFYIQGLRKSWLYLPVIFVQLLSIAGGLMIWMVTNPDAHVVSTVEFEGKTYHLVHAAPAANDRLDLYQCETTLCRGTMVVYTDSSPIIDAALTVEGEELVVIYNQVNRQRIQPGRLPDVPRD